MNKLTENMKYSLLNLFIPILQFRGADTEYYMRVPAIDISIKCTLEDCFSLSENLQTLC